MQKRIIYPFDLAKAKKGQTVETRNGLKVIILDFKYRNSENYYTKKGEITLLCKIMFEDHDVIAYYRQDGHPCCAPEGESSDDLVFVKYVEEKGIKTSPTLWAYRDNYGQLRVYNYKPNIDPINEHNYSEENWIDMSMPVDYEFLPELPKHSGLVEVKLVIKTKNNV